MKVLERLEELHRYYAENPIPENIGEIIKNEFGVDISARYGDKWLKNPLIVAPGQLTVWRYQIENIKRAGFAGCVLKSVVGEDKDGKFSMDYQRVKATFIKTVYDEDDVEGVRPIIQWNGRCDTRDLKTYMEFAREVRGLYTNDFLIVGSILAHLPEPGEEFRKEEWIYTTEQIFSAGYDVIEIDFCPSLRKEERLIEQKNILRWYETVPSFVKSVNSSIKVYPKLLNLEFGMEFQVKMAEVAINSGADGIVVANRFFREDLGCAYGGRTLKDRNVEMVKRIKDRFPNVKISATGGVYSGRDVVEYLDAGAENVQLLSFIMGKVKRPFVKKGNKFEQVFHKLIFDPEDGFIRVLI